MCKLKTLFIYLISGQNCENFKFIVFILFFKKKNNSIRGYAS